MSQLFRVIAGQTTLRNNRETVRGFARRCKCEMPDEIRLSSVIRVGVVPTPHRQRNRTETTNLSLACRNCRPYPEEIYFARVSFRGRARSAVSVFIGRRPSVAVPHPARFFTQAP